MNSAKRSSHPRQPSNSKNNVKHTIRTLNEDYYINCHKATVKPTIDIQRAQTAKKSNSKTKLRSITLATEPQIHSHRPAHKQKIYQSHNIKGNERTRSRTLLKSRHSKKMSQNPKSCELQIIYERVATTLTRYKQKLTVLNQENKKLWEENRKLRSNSVRR